MEAVGLVLGIFPLVVGGIQFYIDSCGTVKEMWRPTRALGSIFRELDMEKCKFENNCTILLKDLVSASDLELLMENPGGPLWSADDLQKKLKSCHGPVTVKCYLDAIAALVSALQTLQNEFKLSRNDTPEPSDRKALKKYLKKIQLVVSKAKYKEILDDIRKINSDLATLTGQSKLTNSPLQMIEFATHYKRIRNHAINLYGVLKEKLQVAPVCTCTVPHNVNLRLEAQSFVTAQQEKGRGRGASLRFHVILSFDNGFPVEESLPWNWREMGFEPLDSESEPLKANQVDDLGDPGGKESHMDILSRPTAPIEKAKKTMSSPSFLGGSTSKLRVLLGGHNESSSIVGSSSSALKGPSLSFRRDKLKAPRSVSFNVPQKSSTVPEPVIPDDTATKQIGNLCLAIQQVKSDFSCFGILTDESNRQYRVWSPKKSLPTSEPMGVLSLESLLSDPMAFEKKYRLILGVQLASAVMQLHSTEWLGENWGKRDILFRQEAIRGGNAANTSSVLTQPFVRRIFSRGPCLLPPQSVPTKSIFSPNRSLFSLGVILIELWHGRHLEDLRIEADGNGTGGAANMTDYLTALRQIDEIYRDAGAGYGDAVRRCIVGLDHRNASLEADDFKNEVHTKVVFPLVENLESFCGMSLVELLEK